MKIENDFFFTDNKSGKKTNKKWLKKNYPEYYKIIVNHTPHLKDISFREKVCLYLHGLYNIPQCSECGKRVNFSGKLKTGYNKFCSIKCLNGSSYHKEKIKHNNLKKYGTESHNTVDEIKDKKKQSYQKKYGVDNPMKSDVVKNNYKKLLTKKYNVDNVMRINDVIINKKNDISLGNEKNIKRVIDKLSKNYIFLKHENKKFQLKCKKCNNDFTINSNLLNSRYVNNTPICLNCNPKKSYTHLQNLIIEKLNNVNYVLNDRQQLKKEIETYFPDHKLGVEINGLYWHSEVFKENDYHINKTKLAEKKGIDLLHFFEDEILFKLDIVLSIIKNKLSQPPKNDLTKDYHIKEVDNGTAKKFLEKNHIEGFVKSYINIGLYHYEKLISLMTMKKGSEKCYEILRHCNEINEQFVEGIDALLNYFIDKFKPLKIVSFSDVRLPNDKLYKELGFKEIKYNNKPNYFYFKLNDYKRKRVRNIDSNDNIKKYLKIYDCGKKKYELDLR